MENKYLKELDKEENTNGSSLENRENKEQNKQNIPLSNPPIPQNPPNSSNSPDPIIPNPSNSPIVSDLESNIESMELIEYCVKLDEIQSMSTRKENNFKNNNLSDEKEKNKDKDKKEQIIPNKIVRPKTKSNSRKEKKNKEKNIKIKEETNININKTLINGNEKKNFENEMKKIEREINKNINFDVLSSISINHNDNDENFNLRILLKQNAKLSKEKDEKKKSKEDPTQLPNPKEKISEDKTRHIKPLINSDENGQNIHCYLELEEEQEFNNLDDCNNGIWISNNVNNNSSEEGNIRNHNQTIKESETEILEKKRKRNNSS